MFSEEKLKDFGTKVAGLIRGRDLSRREAREMFRQVLLNASSRTCNRGPSWRR